MIELVFYLFIVLIIFTYIGYSLLILALSILFHKKVFTDEKFTPPVSILIAAYNEEKSIAEKLNNTLHLVYPREKLEIIVVSDGSTDRTDEIVKGYTDDRIVLFRVEGRVGKTDARNQAVQIAHGDIVVFSDATTIYDRNAIKKMVRNFADSSVGAVSGRYDYIRANSSSMNLANVLFWQYENFIKTKQSRIKTLTGMSGCINSFRKALYVPLPPNITEDLVEPLKILEKGFRIVFEPEAVAYEATTENVKQEFKMRVRVITQGIRGLLYMKGLFNPFRYGEISFQLFAHKVLRWFVPFFLLGLFISNIFLLNDSITFKMIFIMQILFYMAALAGLFLQGCRIKVGLFGIPLYFCTLNMAALIAFVKVLKGGDIRKWETVR